MKIMMVAALALTILGSFMGADPDPTRIAVSFLEAAAELRVEPDTLRKHPSSCFITVQSRNGVSVMIGRDTSLVRSFVHNDPRIARKGADPVDPDSYIIRSQADAVQRANRVLTALGMLSDWNLKEVKLSVDKMGQNGELETMAIASVTFEGKIPEADFLVAPPHVRVQFDRIDGRLFFYAREDVQYRFDAEVRVSLDEARRIAERDLLQWHVPAAWRTVRSWREGHCMDVEERTESERKRLPVPERAPAYPAYRFDLSSPEPSFIVVRATDGKVVARGLAGGGFGD